MRNSGEQQKSSTMMRIFNSESDVSFLPISWTHYSFLIRIKDEVERQFYEVESFFFGGRQVRFSFNEEHYFVDLVFYNRFLKCFVLLDLKIGKLKHQDLGQMQMYVNYYDRFIKKNDENNTIGIVICKTKEDAIVEITLPENNRQIFAAQYETILPSKKELVELIKNNS